MTRKLFTLFTLFHPQDRVVCAGINFKESLQQSMYTFGYVTRRV